MRVGHIRDTEFNVPVLQAGLSHSLPCPFNHWGSEIYPDDSAFFPEFVGGQRDVYSTAATEIHDHFTGLKVREAGGVAAAS
ncbi:MAG: hypothetical protein MAG451_00822 [Anaerolineales bacterium]|nr:hypothetical protein [Anaerolineales bacterium]